jgi:uncharacterized LabA/DUF88 family protein
LPDAPETNTIRTYKTDSGVTRIVKRVIQNSTRTPDIPQPTETTPKIIRKVRKIVNVLAVVDGDNLHDFFSNQVESPLYIISHYINGRPLSMSPKLFITPFTDTHAQFSNISMLNILNEDTKLGLDVQRVDVSLLGYNKGYSDFELFIHILRHIKEFQTLLLFTSDIDYLPMIEYLYQDYGKKTELYYYGPITKQDIREAIPEKGLIKSYDMCTDFIQHYEFKSNRY